MCTIGLFQIRLSLFFYFLLSSGTNRRRTQKSDKITFSKIKIFPPEQGGNTCFLKNYGISVYMKQKVKSKFKKIKKS